MGETSPLPATKYGSGVQECVPKTAPEFWPVHPPIPTGGGPTDVHGNVELECVDLLDEVAAVQE